MSVKHGILGLLDERPRHGYELKTGFDGLTGGLWDLNVGQVYSTLERMRKDGLVALGDDGGGDERKVYRITPIGREELESWLESPPLEARPYRDEMFVRLSLLLDRDLAAAVDMLDTQRRVYQLQMADLTRQKLAVRRSNAEDRQRRELFLDAALLHMEADLKWLDTVEEKVRDWAGTVGPHPSSKPGSKKEQPA